MSSWNDLLDELEAHPNEEKGEWLKSRLQEALTAISRQRDGQNVILYGTAFLQKPGTPAPFLQLTGEEINGFMSVMYRMDWDRNLILILHSPGGLTNAAETLVCYLLNKFDHVEVVIPTFAMSAGTMISLAADRLIMGNQSQLGPIDPQMPIGGRSYSARAIVDQFDQAKKEILEDKSMGHVWAPVLSTIGPAMLQEARNALEYGERMVAGWLAGRMFRGRDDAQTLANAVAAHFNDATVHKSHGRRIDRAEAREQGLDVVDLEDEQELQDAVLTAYHLMTLVFEKSPATKVITSDAGRSWFKNVPQQAGNPQG